MGGFIGHSIWEYSEAARSSDNGSYRGTLPETNMETQAGPMKTTVPLKWGYMGFHVSFGECTVCVT